MWKVVISSNLNPPLKLFFYSPVLANNNLLLKIYCENIVIAFLNCHFLFFILFFLSISSIRFFFFFSFFFSLVFSPPHTYIHSSSLLFLFLLDSRSLSSAFSLSLSLSLFLLFLFLLDSRIFSNSLCDKKQRKNKQEISCLHHRWSNDTSRRKILLAPPLLALSLLLFSFFFLFFFLFLFLLLLLWFD